MIGCGKVDKAVGRVGAVAVGLDAGSFELQLETPNAASNPSAITVHATRSGVQNLILFVSDIVSTTLLLFTESKRVENNRHLTL